MNYVQAAMHPRAPGCERFYGDHLRVHVGLPQIREAAAVFFMFVFVPRIHSEKSHEAGQHDRIFVG